MRVEELLEVLHTVDPRAYVVLNGVGMTGDELPIDEVKLTRVYDQPAVELCFTPTYISYDIEE